MTIQYDGRMYRVYDKTLTLVHSDWSLEEAKHWIRAFGALFN